MPVAGVVELRMGEGLRTSLGTTYRMGYIDAISFREATLHGHGEDLLVGAQPGGAPAQGVPVRCRRGADPARGSRVVLEPIDGDWDWLDAVTGPVDADFAAAAQEAPGAQERPELDDLFE